MNAPSAVLLDGLVENATIQVVRVVRLTVNEHTHERVLGIGRAVVQQVESELAGDNSRIIRAGTLAGVKHGESSWAVGNLISVKVRN